MGEPIGRLNGVVVDGADTHALAAFWSEVFGTTVDSIESDGHYIDLHVGDAVPTIIRFQRVPEGKAAKNRLHLDVEVASDLAGAIRRIESLGGSRVGETMNEYGWSFQVMQDIEGNEFCLILAD